jgi:hypothetical protein
MIKYDMRREMSCINPNSALLVGTMDEIVKCKVQL